MRAEEIMNRRLEIVDPNITVLEVIEKIVNKRIRSVLVKLKEKDYGVITLRDVVYRCLARGVDPKNLKAYEIASKPLVTVEKETSVEEILAIMERAKIGNVFVREGDKIVGSITFMDVMSGYLISRLL